MTAVSADPPAAVKRYWFTPLAAIALVLIGCLGAPSVGHAQESKTPDRYTEVADKLLSLTKLPLPDCRWHADVTHPEDGSLDDSAWKPISLGANFESGVQVFRCWFTVSQKVNGYDVRGANLKFAMDLQGDGMTMLCVTHEMGFARQVANRIVFMDNGRIIETNEPRAFFSNPEQERTRLFLSQIKH